MSKKTKKIVGVVLFFIFWAIFYNLISGWMGV